MFGSKQTRAAPGFNVRGSPKPAKPPQEIIEPPNTLTEDEGSEVQPFITKISSEELAEIEKAEKLRRLSLFDVHDLILKVGDTNLYVSKKQMTTESPVIEQMLSSPEHNGKDTNEISLDGKDVDTVVEFLRCTLPGTNEDVTDITVHAILPLADEYQTQKTLKKADDFLAEKSRQLGKKISSEQTIRNIIQAEKYQLSDFLEESIKIASRKKFDKIAKHPQFEEISKDVRLKIALNRWDEMDTAITATGLLEIESQTVDFLKPIEKQGSFTTNHNYDDACQLKDDDETEEDDLSDAMVNFMIDN